jgi:hypothetical protein
MDIYEFAAYLSSRSTDKAKELYYQLVSNISFYDSDDRMLDIIANVGTYDSYNYSYDELREWLNDDSEAYDYVDYVINSKYTSFYDLLKAAKRNKDYDQYHNMYAELEKILDDFDGDNELDDDDDTPVTYESILNAL